MGKSNKKVKSDRINALRKQYDAFLEEDKKRKERNDFILGKLDKMRYTPALVPVRHKPITPETRPAVVDRLGYQSEFPSVRDFQPSITNHSQLFPDIPIKNNEDIYLIQEISKKYILIPKLRTTFTNNYVRNATTNQNTERLQKIHLDGDPVPVKDLIPNTNENTDWKSKYEILNILKNEEKGKQPADYTGFVDASEYSIPKESLLGNNQHQVATKYYNHVNTDIDDETAKEYVSEFPEKDIPTDTLHSELPKDSQYSLNNIVCSNPVPIANTNSENYVVVANVDQTGAIGDQLQNITVEYEHSNDPNIDISRPHEVTNYYEPQPETDVNLTSRLTEVYSKQSAQINEENVNVQDEYPVEVGSYNIHVQNESMKQHESADSEQVVYVDDNGISPMPHLNYNSPSIPDVNDSIFEEHPAKVSNIQEFAPNNGVQMKTDAIVIPGEQTDINSDVDTIERAEPVIEQIENSINITESIEDFNAEQREMFYSELTAENYPNQEGDVMNPIEFSQNEFTQNQDYAYYENTESEAYPVELNDEEVTQRYDPNYEQQYAGLDQGLEQQQYVQPERGNNEIDPEFEMLQHKQQFESQGKIEETLDVEDGYIELKHEAEAIEMPRNLENVETDNSDVKKVPAF